MEHFPIYSKVLVRINDDGWNKGYMFEALSSVALSQDPNERSGVFYYVDQENVTVYVVRDPVSGGIRANCFGMLLSFPDFNVLVHLVSVHYMIRSSFSVLHIVIENNIRQCKCNCNVKKIR